MLYYFSIVWFLLVPYIAAGQRDDAVIHIPNEQGGQPAAPHSHPWMVSIQTTSGEHFCGGALIPVCRNCDKSDIILTAAHCIVEIIRPLYYPTKDLRNVDTIVVMAGKHWLNATDLGEESRKVANLKYHPAWEPLATAMQHDIAIIRTAEPIQFGNTIKPIVLPSVNDTLPPGTKCKVAGWGYQDKKCARVSQLHEINATIAKDSICLADYPNTLDMYDGNWMTCAESYLGQSTTCMGDSGGMMICQNNTDPWIGYGVVSFGGSSCGDHKNTVFTTIRPHLVWIAVTAFETTKVDFNDDFLCKAAGFSCGSSCSKLL